MRMLLKQLAKEKGIAILISSHILSEMENLCDMIAIINRGEIVEQRTLQELKSKVQAGGSTYVRVNAVNFAGRLIQEYTSQKVAIAGDKVMFNVSDTALAEIIILLTKNKISVYGAGEVDFSLEDVFINIVGKFNTSTSIS